MEICSDEHEEIIYQPGRFTNNCPLCSANDRVAELEQELQEEKRPNKHE